VWARWFRDRRLGTLIGFPAIWIFSEWWRTWLLTGFPWLFAGYSQLEAPLSGWAPVIGVLGISAILALTASTIGSMVTARKIRALPIAMIAALWAAGFGLSSVDWSQPDGEPINVAMVQANIPQEFKWAPGHLDSTLDTYLELSADHWGADLVLWPEAALPAYADRITDFLDSVDRRAEQSGSTLITGIPTRISDASTARGYKARNSLLMMGANHGQYHKRHLVPFGEYVPLEAILRGLIDFFDLPMSSFSAGPDAQPALKMGSTLLAPLICYEIVYPDLVTSGVPEAGVLLTISNDTWFGASAGPLQHLQMARMRALENARPVIRGTNNGVSALIDEHGQIIVNSAQFTREVIRGDIQPQTGATPFALLGSWPTVTAMLLSLLILRLRGFSRPS